RYLPAPAIGAGRSAWRINQPRKTRRNKLVEIHQCSDNRRLCGWMGANSMTASTAIDVHTHIIPPGWEDFAGRFGVAGWPSLRRHSNCEATIMLGEREFRKVTDQCFTPVRRIGDMDTEQVAKQLISPVPIMLCY